MPYAGHFDEFGKLFIRPESEFRALAGIGPQDASPVAGRNPEEVSGQADALSLTTLDNNGERQMEQPGLDGRHRDQNGQIRQKNGNTLVRTLREQYGDEFASGYRSDAHLSTVLEREGAESLSQLLKRDR
jgi:hypothetical protein